MRLAQWCWNWLIVPVIILLIIIAVLLSALKHKLKRSK
jgi:hypothetical protein